MKIAYIAPARGIHTIRWANAMAKRGHEVTVISCADHMKDFDGDYHEGVKVVRLHYASPLGYYLNARQLKTLVRRGGYDVVNVHYASGYGTLGRMAGLKNAVLNIWGSDVYDFPYKSAFNMSVIKKNLSFYEYASSTSRCMGEHSKKLFDREYFITPFGVDTELFRPSEGKKVNDKIVIGTVKMLVPLYGILDSIKAFVRLCERLKEEGDFETEEKLVYEIYGRGKQQKELQALIDESGMAGKIRLCGFVKNENLPEVLNTFDIFCCCSLMESFGVAVVEAMACGIPVVTSDAEGFNEIVKDGETGLIAPRGNIERIADCLYKLVKDKERRDKMGIEGVRHVRALYDWNKSVDIMLNVYERAR